MTLERDDGILSEEAESKQSEEGKARTDARRMARAALPVDTWSTLTSFAGTSGSGIRP